MDFKSSNDAHTAYESLSRPTTASMMKMFSKIVPFLRSSHKRYTACELQRIIGKYARDQQQAAHRQQALVTAFSVWSADLPDAETAALMADFVLLLDTVGVMNRTQADRLNSLKVHLGAIAKRESRQQALLTRHTALQRQHAAAALKHGPQAQQTSMILDEIEENEYNLKLIEQQLMRTAASSLREACDEYVMWLNDSLLSIHRLANQFQTTFRESSPESGKRYMPEGGRYNVPRFPFDSVTSSRTDLGETERIIQRVEPELQQREEELRSTVEDQKPTDSNQSRALSTERKQTWANEFAIYNFERNQEGWK